MFGTVIRLLVSLLVLALVLRSVDLSGVAETLNRLDPGLVGWAILLQMGSQAVAAERWHRVMVALRYQMGFSFYLRSFFKGSFFNQGLPTSIGGDAVRVMDVAGEGHRKRDAFSGILIDRGLGVIGLLLLNAMAILGRPEQLPEGVFWMLSLVVALGLAGFVGVWQVHRLKWLDRLRVTLPLTVVSRRLAEVLRGRRFPAQLGLSVLVHLFSMAGVYFAGASVGLDYDLLTYIVIVPPVILLTIVPISMAGWGVREGAMVGLFTLIGAEQAVVLSMSILYGVVLIIASLPGLYVYLAGRRARAEGT